MSDSFTSSEQEVEKRLSPRMDEHLRATEYTVAQKIAITCRLLFDEGHVPALAGQVSARAEDGASCWTLRWGPGFDEATASDVIRVDRFLEPIEGGGMANPGTRFHPWIYENRPDVNAIVHTHPPATAALSMLGEPLEVSHMDTTPLYENCAFLKDWPGLPFGDEEGEIISGALGDKRAGILAHHGLVVATTSIEEAAFLAIFLEKAARMHLDAKSVGPIKPVPPELAREARDFLLKPNLVAATFDLFARRLLRRQGDEVLG